MAEIHPNYRMRWQPRPLLLLAFLMACQMCMGQRSWYLSVPESLKDSQLEGSLHMRPVGLDSGLVNELGSSLCILVVTERTHAVRKVILLDERCEGTLLPYLEDRLPHKMARYVCDALGRQYVWVVKQGVRGRHGVVRRGGVKIVHADAVDRVRVKPFEIRM